MHQYIKNYLSFFLFSLNRKTTNCFSKWCSNYYVPSLFCLPRFALNNLKHCYLLYGLSILFVYPFRYIYIYGFGFLRVKIGWLLGILLTGNKKLFFWAARDKNVFQFATPKIQHTFSGISISGLEDDRLGSHLILNFPS